MSFSSRYSITNLKKEESRVSISIDDIGDGVISVLLLVPDKNDIEHDHIRLSRDHLKQLKKIRITWTN